MRIIFPNWKPARDRFRRLQREVMGSVHRNAVLRIIWPQRLGALRRMGSYGEETRHGRARWTCESPEQLSLGSFDPAILPQTRYLISTRICRISLFSPLSRSPRPLHCIAGVGETLGSQDG